MENYKFAMFTIAIIFGVNLIVSGVPVDKVETTTILTEDNSTSPNGTHKELSETTKKPIRQVYVIKAVTYEIGILADVPDNDTTLDDNNGTVSRQQVDLSFFNAESNDSFINFGDVPLPVQTNVSGQIITGISPVHIGAVQDVGDILKSLPFTGTIVNITEGDTSFIHVNRENVTDGDQEIHLDNNSDLSKLPILNNVLLPDSFDEAYNSVNKKP